jgi:acyl-CoA reductase-like NAD-dependent aldehyde dehydrogenase
VKESGVGRESGRFGLEECQEIKYIALDIEG